MGSFWGTIAATAGANTALIVAAVLVLATLTLTHLLRHYLPFRTMSCNEEPLRIWIEISDRAVPSTGASRDIVLCRLQAVQEGEESVAESGPVYVAAHSVNLQTDDICCKRSFRRSRHNYSVVDDTLHSGRVDTRVQVGGVLRALLPIRNTVIYLGAITYKSTINSKNK